MGIEQRQDAGGIGADGVFHAGVETIVHVGENDIETRLCGSELFGYFEPVFLHVAGEIGAKIEELAE